MPTDGCLRGGGAKQGDRGVKVMMLISTVVGGLFIYVIFERFLKKAIPRAQDQRKAIEIGTLIAAVIAVGLAAGSLVYTLNLIDALEERLTALERTAPNPARERP